MAAPRPLSPRLRLVVILTPHIERVGCHLDRFDAYVDGELVCVSRQPRADAARALLARGFDPGTMLHVQHAGHVFDPTVVPQPIGELARWTHIETDRDGIRRVKWQRPEERSDAPRRSHMASPAADDGPSGTMGHPVPVASPGAVMPSHNVHTLPPQGIVAVAKVMEENEWADFQSLLARVESDRP